MAVSMVVGWAVLPAANRENTTIIKTVPPIFSEGRPARTESAPSLGRHCHQFTKAAAIAISPPN